LHELDKKKTGKKKHSPTFHGARLLRRRCASYLRLRTQTAAPVDTSSRNSLHHHHPIRQGHSSCRISSLGNTFQLGPRPTTLPRIRALLSVNQEALAVFPRPTIVLQVVHGMRPCPPPRHTPFSSARRTCKAMFRHSRRKEN
ncbi:unnamed protein product, partial [Ectocarpus sp. 12 AP-2014]